MSEPLVSVITPTYNAEDYVSETIRSVISQTYNNWELIIVDDASSDHTLAVIQEFAQSDDRIKVIPLSKNSGAAVTRNTAIKEARGDYIAFLDADDLWKPEKLSVQINYMQQNDCVISYSSYELMDEQGNSLRKMIKALPKVTYQKMLKSNYIGNLTGIYDAKILGKTYMPNIRKRQDWALWIKLLEKTGHACGIEQSLAYYRVRENSISSNKWNLLKYNYAIYRKALNFGTVKSVLYIIRFLIEHFFIKPQQTTQL